MRKAAFLAVVSVLLTGLPAHADPEAPPVFVGGDVRSIVPDRDGDGTPDLEDINLGGFGLGPYRPYGLDDQPITSVGPENRPAEGVHPAGIWVRSMAFGNGARDVVVVQSLDLQGFFIGFRGCHCGAAAVQEGFEAATGIPGHNLLVHATHQHAGPNVLGHQGGVPTWYLEQVRDRAIASAVAAVEAMEPAEIGTGSVHMPRYNAHRRSTYEAVADDLLVYMHATRPADGSTIATLVNYTAHPTVIGSSNRLIHSDYPGALTAHLDAELGGTSVYINGGLGDVSPRPPAAPDAYARAQAMGEALGDAVIGDIARGPRRVHGDTIRADVRPMTHPVTNPVLLGGSALTVYVRSHDYLTAAPSVSTDYPTSAAPLHVVTQAGGFRIGDAVVIFGPGEIFSSMSIAVRNQTDWTSATLVAGLGGDHVGYIMQSYEYKVMQVQEYEELQSLDPYIGDHVVDVMLAVGRDLQ